MVKYDYNYNSARHNKTNANYGNLVFDVVEKRCGIEFVL